MGYKVLTTFTDLQDEKHLYEVGDTYPRPGFSPSDGRVKELQGAGNAHGVPIIATEPVETAVIGTKNAGTGAEQGKAKETPAKAIKATKRAKKTA